jgi:hypothetical protein
MRSRLLFMSVLAAVLTTACATDFRRDPEFGREAGFAIVSKAADIATTRAGVEQGFVESNPVLGRDQRTAVLVQVAGTSFVLWYSARLKAEGNRHWKVPLRIWAVISGGSATWNGTLLARSYRDSSMPYAGTHEPLLGAPVGVDRPGERNAAEKPVR